MNRKAIKGFTLVELMVVLAVFSIVAYGIFSFFTSQSANIGMNNAIAVVNKNGQVLQSFMRQELLVVKTWRVAELHRMQFQTADGIFEYEFDTTSKTLVRRVMDQYGVEVSSTQMAPNVEAVEFHYYASDIGDDPSGFVTDADGNPTDEILSPVLACTLPVEECTHSLINIRMAEARFVIVSKEPVFTSDAFKKIHTSDNPLTGESMNDGKIRREFTVRAQSRNLYEITSDISKEAGCGKLEITTSTPSIAACDPDGQKAQINVKSYVTNTDGSYTQVPDNTVQISVSNKDDSALANNCADAGCSGPGPIDQPTADPASLDSSSRPGGSGNFEVTSPVDRKGNQILIQAQWFVPTGYACGDQVSGVRSNQLQITIKAGSADHAIYSGPDALGTMNMGVESATAINTCASGGCGSSSTTVRIQLVDACGNPAFEDPATAAPYTVTFTVANSADGNKYGSFSPSPGLTTFTATAADNGIYAVSVFTTAKISPNGHIPIEFVVNQKTSITGTVNVPEQVCAIPSVTHIITPSDGTITDPLELQACPGASRTIEFNVQNGCGDVIPVSAVPGGWTATINSSLDDVTEAQQIGTLDPVTQASSTSFKTTYWTGGHNVSPLDMSYCGSQSRYGIPVSISYTPLAPGQDKLLTLNLEKCPPVNISISVAPNLANGMAIPSCGPAGGEDQCMEVGCPTSTDVTDDWIVTATISSCGGAVSLGDAALLLIANNPNDGNATYPFINGAPCSGTTRGCATVFPPGAPSTETVTMYMNSGNLTVAGATTLTQKLDVKAFLCVQGGDGVLNTSGADSQCSTSDTAYPEPTDTVTNNKVDFWAGPSKSGFMNQRAVGSFNPGFQQGKVGLFSSSNYLAADELTDLSVWSAYPTSYGPVVQTPALGISSGVYVEVMDCDENKNHTSSETINMNFNTGETPDSGSIYLTETGPDTGIFRGILNIQRHVGGVNTTDLDAVLAGKIDLTYNDPSGGADQSSGSFYMSGCQTLKAKDANNNLITKVAPAASATTVSDSSTSSVDSSRNAFHIEMYMPESANFTGNTVSGETARVRIRTGTPDLLSSNQVDYLTLTEQNSLGAASNDGYYRIDQNVYNYLNGTITTRKSFEFLTKDPSALDPCGSPLAIDKETCLWLDDTPSVVYVEFDQDSQNNVTQADCAVQLSVSDVNKPIVTFDHISFDDPNGTNLANGTRITTDGTLYFSGTADDGSGTVTEVIISNDNGVSGNPVPYDAINKTWDLTADTIYLPDGIYNIMFRAEDSTGLFGYSTEAPTTDIGIITIIIDKIFNNIDIADIWTMLCGPYTFTADTSGYFIPNSQKRVNFRIYHWEWVYDSVNLVWVSTYVLDDQALDIIPNASGIASYTVDVTSLSTLDWHDHYIEVEVYDSLNPADRYTDYTWFYVNEGAPYAWPWVTNYTWSTPLSGYANVQISYYAGCYGASTIQAQLYDSLTTLKRSNFFDATLAQCWTYSSVNPSECVEGYYTVQINTNPSNCAQSDGFIGDTQTSVFVQGVTTNGIPFTGDMGWGIDVDNPPVITGTGGGSTVGVQAGTTMNLAVEVKDCDGVPSDSLHVTAKVVNNTAYYTGLVTDLSLNFIGGPNPPWDSNFGYPLATTNWPICSIGSGYFPDGQYKLNVIADDAAPSSPCYLNTVLNQYNYCGQLNNATFTVSNDPVNFNITAITPLISGKVSGSFNIQFHAEDCDLMVMYPTAYKKLLVDGLLTNPATGLAWADVTELGSGNYVFSLDSHIIEKFLGTHTLTVRIFDGTGTYFERSQSVTIDNTGPCVFSFPTYSKTFSGSNTTVVMSGTLKKTDMITAIVGQSVSVKDNTFSGGVLTTTTNSSGAWSLTFNYSGPKKYNINYTLYLSDNTKCSAGTSNINFTVP